MYKKRGRHDIEAVIANNEEQFATQFFNFMRKHPELVISQVSIPQINFDIGTAMPRVVPPLSTAGSAPNHQKYHMDDINEPTPCTLLYVKGRSLRTIKAADTIVVATRIMHGRPVPLEYAVIKVTRIREGYGFENLDYPGEEEGIEKMKDGKGNFILWPRKYIIIKTYFSTIVFPQSREDEGTPTSQNPTEQASSQNPPKTTPPPENPPSSQPLEHHSPQHRSPPHGHSSKSSHTSPPQNPTEQAPYQIPPKTTPPSENPPPTQALEHHSPQHRSPPHGHSPKSPPTTPPQNPTEHAHHHSPPHGHSSKSPPHTTPHQNPSTKRAPQYRSPPHVHSLKSPHTTPHLQNPPTKQALQHHSPPHVHSSKSPPHTTPHLQKPPNALKKQDAIVDEPSKYPKTILDKFYDGLKNYKTKKPLEDLALVGMTVE
jgi:hypothetical protein